MYSLDPDIDAEFDEDIAEELTPMRARHSRIKLGILIEGVVQKRKGWVVKPAGHPDSPMMIFLHNPTYKAWKRAFQTVHEPTSETVTEVFSKFGRRPDIFMVDSHARRVDKAVLRGQKPVNVSLDDVPNTKDEEDSDSGDDDDLPSGTGSNANTIQIWVFPSNSREN